VDLGGIRIEFAKNGRRGKCLSQTMLSGNGKLIG
jgi:hypothetical protein